MATVLVGVLIWVSDDERAGPRSKSVHDVLIQPRLKLVAPGCSPPSTLVVGGLTYSQ